MTLLQIAALVACLAAGAALYQRQHTEARLHDMPLLVVQPTNPLSSALNPASTPSKVASAPIPRKVTPAPALQPLMRNPLQQWYLGDWDKKTLANMADIDAVLALSIPDAEAGDPAFFQLSQQLKSVKMGRRYSVTGTTSPLLAFYVYIAKYSPNTIYRLFNSGDFDRGRLGHLIKYGYLHDWPEHIQDVQKLLLTEEELLLSLWLRDGKLVAQNAFIDAFFNFTNPKLAAERISLRNLAFAFTGMTAEQKNQLNRIFLDGQRRIDPRRVVALKRAGILTTTRKQTIALIKQLAGTPSSHRGMSSYFSDAVGLGSEYYLYLLIGDIVDNNEQPNHFYCAACGLAVFTEGLLGAPLIERVKNRQHYTVDRNPGQKITRSGAEFIISEVL